MTETQIFPTALSESEQNLLEQIDPAEVEALLKTLIQARSDFPPGDTRRVVQVLGNKLNEAHIPFEIVSLQEHQPSLLAKLGEGKPTLVYHSHLDTVPAGELEHWSVDPYSGEVRQGKMIGRGAGDDKSSAAAQVIAAIALKRAGINFNGSLRLATVADEESGGLQGTQWLHQTGMLQADALVVGEQTENRIAIAERVACGIDLTVFGKSAHGAMPWAGENAVLKTAGALHWLQEKLFPVLQSRRHPYLPPATLNIGKIQGGIQWSIVPERCKVDMDRRLLPGETREMAMQEIRQSLDDYSRLVEPLRYELYSSGEVAANIDTPADDPFVNLANRVLRDLCGEARDLTGYMQTSDGRWFARDRIPIIIFGPSDPSVAHASNEYVDLAQVTEATQFLTLLAYRWLGGGK